MIGAAPYLQRYCQSQHGGDNHGFLKFGVLPQQPKHLNFAAFLKDPSVTLEIDPNYVFKKAGRPTKIKIVPNEPSTNDLTTLIDNKATEPSI